MALPHIPLDKLRVTTLLMKLNKAVMLSLSKHGGQTLSAHALRQAQGDNAP